MAKSKLIGRYRLGSKLLKVYETSKGLRGKLYRFEWDASVSPNVVSLVLTDSASFLGEVQVSKVKSHFDMLMARKTNTDEYIEKDRRVIWSNDDYEEWEACMLEDYPDKESREEDDIEISYERYMEDCSIFLDDERDNLNIPVDGVIIAFASLGLWNGRRNCSGKVGTKVSDILYSGCDYLTWYCDRYNVRCKAIHHDGINYYLYRVAKDEAQADELANKVTNGMMTEEQFRKATKSLRPYVAKVYGF